MAEASEKNLTGEGLAALWELIKAEDSKINDALTAAVAEKAKVVTGTYTGNGAASRTVSLGAKPKVVIVFQAPGTQPYVAIDGLTIQDTVGIAGGQKSFNAVAIVSNGFKTTKGTGSGTTGNTMTSNPCNYADTTYFYYAFM